jgi:hypothetical protein
MLTQKPENGFRKFTNTVFIASGIAVHVSGTRIAFAPNTLKR